MSDWVPLLDFLREDLAGQIDHAILHDPDRELAALLAANRERVLRLALDQLELAALRRALADATTDDSVESGDTEPGVIRINGKRHMRWS